jgi:hypothetical protein
MVDCKSFGTGIESTGFGDIERAGEPDCCRRVDEEGSVEVTEGDVADTSVFVLGTGEEVGETSTIAASKLLPSLEGLALVSLTPTRRPPPLRPRSLLPVLSALPFTRRTPLRP